MKIRARIISTVAGVGAVVLLAMALARLFLLRFDRGDIWPPYSTLRTDPLGCKVLYESLAKCGFQVSRNNAPLHKINPNPDAAMFFLGDTVGLHPNLDRLPAETAARLTAFVRRGGRLVVTLQPWVRQPDMSPAASSSSEEQRGLDESESDHNDFHMKPASYLLTTNWLGIAFVTAESPSAAPARALPAAISLGLPRTLTSNTALAFTNIAPDWTPLYSDANGPVMIERRLGQGSIVFSTLSFFVSNEAMRTERQPQLLLWLTGGKPELIFDETHHGLIHEDSFGTIARKHGLHRPLLVLMVVGILLLWKNTLPLAPVFQPDEQPGAFESGKDSISGLASLLRRSVPSASIIETCWRRWQSSKPLSFRCLDRNISDMSSVISAMRPNQSEQETVRIYNELARLAAPHGARDSARGGKHKWILHS